MAWLQNLAGKAEDFLNKIDKNAATVLSETASSVELTEEALLVEVPECSTPTSIIEIVNERETPEDVAEDVGIVMTASPQEIIVFEKSLDFTEMSSKESTTSLNHQEDLDKFEDHIKKLEEETQQLTKQNLNLQHLYSEAKNENASLQNQAQRSAEIAQQAYHQMEQYKVRAQLILQEKEKLINVKSNTKDCDSQNQILSTYNEELKKELQFQQNRNEEYNEKIESLNRDLSVLQQQYVAVQNSSQQSNDSLHENLKTERKFRANFEEDLQLKTKEIQTLQMQLASQQSALRAREMEIVKLKDDLRLSSQPGSDVGDTRFHTLTQTLMKKQNTLETITSERNALKIQLEKLEGSYNRLLNQKERTVVQVRNETDDLRTQVPRLMQVSPLDVGMTRKVKHAYSTLDTISIRTGVFLRRYPLARIFVFCYMILLHIWVLIILFTYVPTTL
ncbi:PREDICTED: golgin-84 [Nicrophorus vespilloides]|uniref:Golgin-84 n=1 Tax=Nicrophorus vespilloides TaxID=110193 RepID=A0ABM1MY79_NICVS|nr:PREDICTED: golgin-84 [Nicrophorus vespilloides]